MQQSNIERSNDEQQNSTQQKSTEETPKESTGDIKEELREVIRAELSDDDLEPLSPADALEKHLTTNAPGYSQKTLDSHASRLGHFVEWCESEGISNLNELGGADINDYRNWRREDGDLNTVSEKTQQDTLRVFIRFCETIDAVSTGLSNKVISPSLNDDEGARDVMVPHEKAQEILNHLDKYEYASHEHVTWVLLAQTGMRTGTVRSLDEGDYYPDADNPHLKVGHSPEKGTPIKNGGAGERRISIPPSACEVLDDYFADQRPDVTDDFGREPLLATQFGRIGRSTIRKYVYKWTRPCAVTGECPHGKEIDECEAADRADAASKCESSKSPHPVRRGYITHELESGVPEFVVSQRCNVSEEIIDIHYDNRNEEKKMSQRKELLDAVYEDDDRYGSESMEGEN
jgi:site-specific recombinase XerD